MPEAMYWRIAQDLRQEIESGKLAPGAQLATELELRERYNASRNTVRDAVKWLVNHGLVVTRPGQGIFVTRRIDPFVTTLSADPRSGPGGGEGTTHLSEARLRNREPTTSDPRVEIQRAAGEIAELLGVDEGTQLISRHQERFIDGTPWSLQTSFYPMSFVTQGASRLLEATNIAGGAVQYLRETSGLDQAGYRDRIRVRAPDADETAFFGLPEDSHVPIIVMVRTAFTSAGAPMRVTVTVYPADRNQFVIDIGDVPAPQDRPTPAGQQPSPADPQAGPAPDVL